MKGISTHFLQKLRPPILRLRFLNLSVYKHAVYLSYKGSEDVVNIFNEA